MALFNFSMVRAVCRTTGAMMAVPAGRRMSTPTLASRVKRPNTQTPNLCTHLASGLVWLCRRWPTEVASASAPATGRPQHTRPSHSRTPALARRCIVRSPVQRSRTLPHTPYLSHSQHARAAGEAEAEAVNELEANGLEARVVDAVSHSSVAQQYRTPVSHTSVAHQC